MSTMFWSGFEKELEKSAGFFRKKPGRVRRLVNDLKDAAQDFGGDILTKEKIQAATEAAKSVIDHAAAKGHSVAKDIFNPWKAALTGMAFGSGLGLSAGAGAAIANRALGPKGQEKVALSLSGLSKTLNPARALKSPSLGNYSHVRSSVPKPPKHPAAGISTTVI